MKNRPRSITSGATTLPLLAVILLFGVPAAKAATYSDTVKADNPIAYYRLEETSGTTAADSSASGAYPATYNVNGAYPQQGEPGIDINSVSLQAGMPSSVTAGYYPDLNPAGPFSFEVWVRPTSTSATDYRCPIGNFGGWGFPSGWYLYQTPNPGSGFAFIMQGTAVWLTTSYNLLTWYHLVGTYDGTNGAFYVNGTLLGSASGSGYLVNPSNPLGIGQRGDGNCFFDGNLDEVAMYTNALSLARIQAHYQVGTNSFQTPPAGASIRQDPASTTKYESHTAQFTVLADGAPTLLYQWFKRGTLLPGANTSAYSFTCALADDGADFQVIVTNNYGSATSAVATLTVSTNLLVLAQPTSIIRNVGSKAAFEVVADGALPLSYQWYKGASQLIPGATSPTLWLNNVQLADDNTTYFVRVINPYTQIDSDPATLTVQARPVTVPVSGYAKIVMADDPVAFWRLDEPEGSGTAVDAAGSFDGTYTAGAGTFTFGAPTGIPHETDAGVGISGGATVQLPYAIEINPPGAFTVEGWFQPASASGGTGSDYRTALSSMSNPWGAGPTGWLVYQTDANNWSWWPYNGYWSGVQLTAPGTVVAGQWYYLALVYDGTTFTFYVNGVAKASGTDPGFVQNGNVPAGSADYNYNYHVNHDPTASGPMVLGWRSPVDFNPFAGTMDDIAVYNKALSSQQVQNHFLNTVRLSVTRSGSDVVLSWPFGTLQSAPAVTGTYTNMLSATSPFTNAPSQTKTFYRVQVQ
jgi:hypothetical protein